jgi:hypothetical protein
MKIGDLFSTKQYRIKNMCIKKVVLGIDKY